MTVDEIVTAQDALIEGAEGRELTDDECVRYEQLETQLGAARRREQLAQRHAAARATATPALITKVGDGPGDETLNRAFDHYLRTGKENADLQQLRAQSEGTGTAGGFLVPDGFRRKLVDRLKAYGGLANAVEEIVTETGNPLNWPTLDDTSNVGEIVAEGGTFSSGADLVFGEANLGAYKYAAGGASSAPLRVSWELLQDAAFDVQGLVSRKLGERIGRLQAQHIVRGTGAGEPQGIVTGKTGIQTAANNALTYSDFITYMHSVDPAYRESGSCKWAFNDAALSTIRKILDSTGRPILVDAAQGMENQVGGPRLLGYPVVIDQAFANFTNNSPTINWGVFGDLVEGYVVRRVRDVTIVVNPYSRASNFQTEYSAYARMDAVQQNANSYVALTGKT